MPIASKGGFPLNCYIVGAGGGTGTLYRFLYGVGAGKGVSGVFTWLFSLFNLHQMQNL